MEEDYEVWLLLEYIRVTTAFCEKHFRFQEAQIMQLQQQLQAARKESATTQKSLQVQCLFVTT